MFISFLPPDPIPVEHAVVHQEMPPVLHAAPSLRVPGAHGRGASGTASTPSSVGKRCDKREDGGSRTLGPRWRGAAVSQRSGAHGPLATCPHAALKPRGLRSVPQASPGSRRSLRTAAFGPQALLPQGLPAGSPFQAWSARSRPHPRAARPKRPRPERLRNLGQTLILRSPVLSPHPRGGLCHQPPGASETGTVSSEPRPGQPQSRRPPPSSRCTGRSGPPRPRWATGSPRGE